MSLIFGVFYISNLCCLSILPGNDTASAARPPDGEHTKNRGTVSRAPIHAVGLPDPVLASIFAVLALTDDLLAETLRALDGRV